jgi:fatty acid CoA ligase FadD9
MTADSLDERRRDAAIHRAASMRDALRRARDVLARDQALAACTSTKGDFAALAAHDHAIDVLADACARYAMRPCLGERARDGRGGALSPRFDTIAYGELWQRAAALATALAASGLAAPGELVAIHGFASIDWVIADVACLYLGAPSLPLQTSLRAQELAHVAGEAHPRCIVASVDALATLAPIIDDPALRGIVVIDELHVTAAQVERAVAAVRALRSDLRVEPLSTLVADHARRPIRPPVQHDGDPLVTLSYTSGSTGMPKGVVYPDHRWLQRMREALVELPLPYVTLCYLPLSQMGGRLGVLRSLVWGGLTCFASATDLSTFVDDSQLVRPTQLMLIPRVSNLVYQAFQRRVLAEGTAREPEILADMRAHFLGDRLCLVTTGAAPTSGEVLAFIARCFGVSVIDAYGATELGTVTVNGLVRPEVEYKLVDVPELGYTARDVPYPRGELLVRTPYRSPGYFGGAAAERPLAEADGFVRSGDIVEERGPRHVVWIDRRNDVVRLQQGEFVSVSRLEQIFAVGGPFVAQIYIYANPLRAYVQAVVVPNTEAVRDRVRGHDHEATKRLLASELARIGRAHDLKRHEIPRAIIVEPTPFSRDNGLLTESDKPRRAALRAAYAARLDALADELAARQLRDLEAAELAALARLAPLARLAHAAAHVLGLDGDVDTDASFVDLGGDSLSAMRFVELLARVGTAPAVAAVLDAHGSLAGLAASDAPTIDARTFHGDAPTHVRASQLALAHVLGDHALAPAAAATSAPRVVLVTGASGFLGRFVVLELLAREPGLRAIAIVRARDDAGARARIAEPFMRDARLAARFASHAGALTCKAGDLMKHRFGLDARVYDRLADEVDTVVHCGALVNHTLPYADLFQPNVAGTIEVMRFASHRRAKRIRFASSVGIAAGLHVDAPIGEDVAAARLRAHFPLAASYGLGYSATKWAAEVMLAELVERGVPVQVFRCGMLLAHREYERQINAGDVFSRLLFGLARTSIAPPSFYTGTPRPFDGLPVDLVAAAIAAVPAEPGLAIYHASNDRDDSASLDRVADFIADAGFPIARTATYLAWFEQLQTRLAALDDAARRRSPAYGIERWAQPTEADAAPRFATTRFRALVRDVLGEPDLPPLDAASVRRSLRALELEPP